MRGTHAPQLGRLVKDFYKNAKRRKFFEVSRITKGMHAMWKLSKVVAIVVSVRSSHIPFSSAKKCPRWTMVILMAKKCQQWQSSFLMRPPRSCKCNVNDCVQLSRVCHSIQMPRARASADRKLHDEHDKAERKVFPLAVAPGRHPHGMGVCTIDGARSCMMYRERLFFAPCPCAHSTTTN